MSAIRKIHTENAPAAVGPYSQAVEVNGMLYTSGQIPVDLALRLREKNIDIPEGILTIDDMVAHLCR